MSLALILMRWLHLSASILVASLFLFEAAIVFPAAREPSTGTKRLLETFQRLICRAAWWMLLTALVSWFVWSWLLASMMTGDGLVESLESGDWSSILTETQFGHLWLFRVFVGLVSWIILWAVTRRPGRRKFMRTILTGLLVVELVSLAWVGHGAASPGRFGVIHLLADAFHLLAAAFWPGALVPLAVFLFLLLKPGQVEANALAATVVRRFSGSSLIAVAGMASTGLLNCIFMIGSFQALLTSPYGLILTSKLFLFSVMIGFGAVNLLLLKPRIAEDIRAGQVSEGNALRSLVRNVIWEIGLGTAVVLIVALLGITAPPMGNRFGVSDGRFGETRVVHHADTPLRRYADTIPLPSPDQDDREILGAMGSQD
jgi:copper resistance protein D